MLLNHGDQKDHDLHYKAEYQCVVIAHTVFHSSLNTYCKPFINSSSFMYALLFFQIYISFLFFLKESKIRLKSKFPCFGGRRFSKNCIFHWEIILMGSCHLSLYIVGYLSKTHLTRLHHQKKRVKSEKH